MMGFNLSSSATISFFPAMSQIQNHKNPFAHFEMPRRSAPYYLDIFGDARNIPSFCVYARNHADITYRR